MTGLIFGVIAVAWIAYLLPWFISHRDQGYSLGEDEVDRLAASMRLIRNSAAESTDPIDPNLVFSTPLIRDAMRAEAARASKTAATRRRIGLLVHAVLLVAGLIMAIALPVSPWVAIMPAILFVGFLLLCRLSVKIVDQQLEARMNIVNHGWDEKTVAIVAASTLARHEDDELSIELSVPIQGMDSLLSPLPITPATYASKPLMPRSVRTIDLSAPVSKSREPIVATELVAEQEALFEDQYPKAVGE